VVVLIVLRASLEFVVGRTCGSVAMLMVSGSAKTSEAGDEQCCRKEKGESAVRCVHLCSIATRREVLLRATPSSDNAL